MIKHLETASTLAQFQGVFLIERFLRKIGTLKPARFCYFSENLLRCFIATKHLVVPKLARTDHRIVLGCGYLTSKSPCGRA